MFVPRPQVFTQLCAPTDSLSSALAPLAPDVVDVARGVAESLLVVPRATKGCFNVTFQL